MNNKHKIQIQFLSFRKMLSTSELAAIFLLLLSFITYTSSTLLNAQTSNASLVPISVIVDNKIIDFPFTDDNTNETLIIHSDKETYGGWDSAAVYFTIENTTKEHQETNFKFLFESEDEYLGSLSTLTPDGQWSIVPLTDGYDALPESVEAKDIPQNFSAKYGSNYLIPKKSRVFFRAIIKFPVRIGDRKFYIEAYSEDGAYGLLDPFVNTDFKYRRKVTINSSQVATTSDAYTFVATTTLDSLKTTGNGGNVEESNGYDIVWTDSDGTTILDYEVEKWDGTTGEITHWVQSAISSTTDKIVYMYYGNSSATDLSDTSGTWTNDYTDIWHLTDLTDSAGSEDLSVGNQASSTTTAQFGTAYGFDGSDDYLTHPSVINVHYTHTLSAWARTERKDAHRLILGNTIELGTFRGFNSLYISYDATPSKGWRGNVPHTLPDPNSAPPGPCCSNQTNYSAVHPQINEWHYIVQNTSSSTRAIWVDGVQYDVEASQGSIANANSSFYIGARKITLSSNGYSNEWYGAIDEIRFKNSSATSPEDIMTDYNNQSCVSCFLTIGSEETLSVVKGTVVAGNVFGGANPTVAISANGGATATLVETDGSGNYSTVVELTADTPVIVWIDDAPGVFGATVTVTSTAMIDLDIYQDQLIVRNDNVLVAPFEEMTNALLATADNGDSDIPYSVSGGNLTLTDNVELSIQSGHTFQPGGTITAYDIDINGKLITGTNDVTLTGHWDATGGTVLTTSTITFATTTAATQTVTSTGNIFNAIVVNATGNGTIETQDQLQASSTVTITAGTLDLNGQNLLVDSTFSNNDILLLEGGETTVFTTGFDTNSGTTTFDGTSTYTSLSPGNKYFNVSFNNSLGTWGPNAQLNASSSITLDAGTLESNGNNIYLDGDWLNNGGTFTHEDSLVLFCRSSGTQSVKTGDRSPFFIFTINDSGGTNTVNILDQLNASSTLYLIDGAFDANDKDMFLGGAFLNNGSTFSKGTATTTFVGSGTSTILSALSSEDLGNIVIDGSAKTILSIPLGGPLTVDNLTIGADDTLNAGSSDVTISGNFINNGTYSNPRTTTFDSTGRQFSTSGGSSFKNFVHSGSGTVVITDATTISGDATNSSGTWEIDGLTTLNGGLTNLSTIDEDASYIIKAQTGSTFNKSAYNGNTDSQLTVSFTDADENIDGTIIDTVTLNITVSGLPIAEAEDVVLSETGVASGVFSGTIPITSLAPAIGDGDLDLTTNFAGNISTTYTDSEDASDAVSILSTYNSNPTISSGGGGGSFFRHPPLEGTSVLINNGATYTNNSQVRLTLFAEDAVVMAVGVTPNLNEVTFQPYRTELNWAFGDGDGEQTIYVKFKDSKGGGSESEIVEDSIIIDTTAPTIPTIETPKDGGQRQDRELIVTGTGEPFTSVQLQLDNGPLINIQIASDGRWSYLFSTLLSGGKHTITVYATDLAGNVSDAHIVNFSLVSILVLPGPPDRIPLPQRFPIGPLPRPTTTPTSTPPILPIPTSTPPILPIPTTTPPIIQTPTTGPVVTLPRLPGLPDLSLEPIRLLVRILWHETRDGISLVVKPVVNFIEQPPRPDFAPVGLIARIIADGFNATTDRMALTIVEQQRRADQRLLATKDGIDAFIDQIPQTMASARLLARVIGDTTRGAIATTQDLGTKSILALNNALGDSARQGTKAITQTLARLVKPITGFIEELSLPNVEPITQFGNSITQTYQDSTDRLARVFLIQLQTEDAIKEITAETLVDTTEPIPSRIPLLAAKEIAMISPFGNLNLAPEPGEQVSLPPGKRVKLYVRPEREVNNITATMLFTTSISIKPHEIKFIFLKPAQATPVAQAKEYIVDEAFYADPDGDGIWETSIVLPVVGGDYTIETAIDYVNGLDEIFKREFLIDPEGYVFRKAGDDEAHLADTTVAIYKLNEKVGGYALWNSGRYDQTNPQITNKTGEYSFLVPAGTYYITAYKKGFGLFETEPIVVTRSTPIHLNIELKKTSIFDIFR